MISMTYLLEMSGGEWTTFVGIGVEFYWVTGWLTLGALAYVVTDWRHLLRATSTPGKNLSNHGEVGILPFILDPIRIAHSLVLLDDT